MTDDNLLADEQQQKGITEHSIEELKQIEMNYPGT